MKYFRDFAVLKDTGKEYWGVQVINVLDSISYFAMITVAAVFLSEEIGLSDIHAGWVITAFTSASSMILLVAGAFTDSLGIRKSLSIINLSATVLRLGVGIVAITPDLPFKGYIIAVLLCLMAPFTAGIATLFQSSIKRFTTKSSRGAGFSLWYLMMNVGLAGAGLTIDFMRQVLELPYSHVFIMAAFCSLACYLVGIFFIKDESQRMAENEEPEEEIQKEKQSPIAIFKAVFSNAAIWRLLVLVSLIIGVRAMFVYPYLLMPKYWLRTIGPDAVFGTLNAINPIGIVIGITLLIPIANKFKVYNMLVYGALISAFSLLPLAIPWHFYGMSIVNTHYTMAILAMAILTIGEVIWSPKLYEFTANIAPKGQEGVYFGLSMVPWFLAKTVVTAFSGVMLTRWCPEEVVLGEATVSLQQAMVDGQLGYWERPEAMWLILSIWAIAGCLIAIALKGWMTKGEQQPASSH